MSKEKADPNEGLSADAALAVDHTPEREAEQLAYFGGEVDPIDNFDATGLDDGSDPNFVAPPASEETEGEDDKDDKDDKDKDDNDEVVPTEEPSDDDAAKDGEDGEPTDGDPDDADDEDPAAEKPKGIPKHRFDEVNEKRKAAETENIRLKAQIEAAKPPAVAEEAFDVRAGEKEYIDLMLDGDTDGALAKREEIDAAKEAKWKAETQASTKTDISDEAEQTQLLSLSKEAEGMFDVFNPESDNYSQPILDKVLTFMRGYEATGEMSRGDAFIAGLSDVVEMYGLEIPGGDPDPVDEGKKPTGEAKVDKRKKKLAEDAITPVVDTGTPSADTGAVVPNIEDMTDAELDALPEKTLARMRGDIL